MKRDLRIGDPLADLLLRFDVDTEQIRKRGEQPRRSRVNFGQAAQKLLRRIENIRDALEPPEQALNGRLSIRARIHRTQDLLQRTALRSLALRIQPRRRFPPAPLSFFIFQRVHSYSPPFSRRYAFQQMRGPCSSTAPARPPRTRSARPRGPEGAAFHSAPRRKGAGPSSTARGRPLRRG